MITKSLITRISESCFYTHKRSLSGVGTHMVRYWGKGEMGDRCQKEYWPSLLLTTKFYSYIQKKGRVTHSAWILLNARIAPRHVDMSGQVRGRGIVVFTSVLDSDGEAKGCYFNHNVHYRRRYCLLMRFMGLAWSSWWRCMEVKVEEENPWCLTMKVGPGSISIILGGTSCFFVLPPLVI